MKPILTIAIPTYNRSEKIYTQVMALLPQLTEKVTLVVLDNHSSIPVLSLFDENVTSKITIHRNQFNIGADANIAKCFDLCETQWLWTLGDDDFVEDFAVQSILSDIESAVEGTIFLNYDPANRYQAKGISDFLKNCDRRYWCLFWMSACIYNLKLLEDSFSEYFYSISTMQPGIVLLVNSLIKHPEYLICVTGKSIHKLAGPDIHWCRDSFIYASLFLFDVLRQHKNILKGTLFRTITGLLYRQVITISKNEQNLNHSLQLIKTIAKKRGLINTFKYDFYWLSRCFYHSLIQH